MGRDLPSLRFVQKIEEGRVSRLVGGRVELEKGDPVVDECLLDNLEALGLTSLVAPIPLEMSRPEPGPWTLMNCRFLGRKGD